MTISFGARGFLHIFTDSLAYGECSYCNELVLFNKPVIIIPFVEI